MDAEQVSRDLFGRPCRLPLALWILSRDKSFFQSEPPRDLGAPTAIRQELARLARAGLLEPRRPTVRTACTTRRPTARCGRSSVPLGMRWPDRGSGSAGPAPSAAANETALPPPRGARSASAGIGERQQCPAASDQFCRASSRPCA